MAFIPSSKYPLLHKHVFGDEAFEDLLFEAEHAMQNEIPFDLHV